VIGSPAVVAFVCRSAAGARTVPSAATVSAVDETGATVTGLTATIGTEGTVTVNIPARAQVGRLTVTLTATVAGNTVTLTEQCEVAGGWWFGVEQLRESATDLQSFAEWTDPQLAEARRRSVVRCEEILGWAGVARYASWSGIARSEQLIVPHGHVRTVRSATAQWGTTTAETISPADIAINGAVLTGPWCAGQLVTVSYVHGAPFIPDTVLDAAVTLAADRLFTSRSTLTGRATRYNSASDGRTYVLDQAGAMKTGLPEVDAVLHAHSRVHGIA
jgi:hypothetical protein